MATKPRTLAANKRRRRARKTVGAVKAVMNPPIFKDVATSIGPAVAAYAATRLLSRIVFTLASRRWPRAARHLGAASSVATLAAVYYGGSRIKQLAPYQEPVMIGAGIAATQAVLQTYVKRYGWVVSDYTEADLALPAKAAAAAKAAASMPAAAAGSEGRDEFSYLEDEIDTYAPPRAAAAAPPPGIFGARQAPAPAEDEFTDDEMSLVDDEDDDVDDYNTGVFAN